MDTLSTIDSDLFLFLNGLHADWLDKVMVLITDMWAWLPLYLLLIYWTVKQYGKRCWWIFLAVGVVVLCSDQISSHLFKPYFQRLRPCFNEEFEGMLHLPKGMAGGRYSFTSSHAANTFAIATFLTSALRNYRPWAGLALYLWAFISSYSRIYIGYHYPGDIVCGAILGILVGLVLWKVFQIIQRKTWKSEQ
jgi:undecaprenyl-diphosphatase